MPGGSFDPLDGIYTPPTPGYPGDTADLPGHVGNPVTGTPVTPGASAPTAPPPPDPTLNYPAGVEGVTAGGDENLPPEIKKLVDEAKKNNEVTVSLVSNGTSGSTGNGTAQRDSLARLRALFSTYGLPDSLGDWAWQRLLDGAGEDEVALSLRDTPEFKLRFPAIDARVKAGLAPISPAEYVAYEQQYRQLMSRAGFPPSFYDQTSDMTDMIANDVSMAELSDRIQNGFMAVKAAPKEVRDEFARLYGVDGDAALASFVLDRNRGEVALSKVIAGAAAAGTGWSYGFRLDRSQADYLGDKGLTQSQLDQGFQTLQQLRDVFTAQTVTEQNNLSAMDQGIGAVFGENLAAKDQINQKIGQRTNEANTGYGAGAASDRSGLYASKAVR